MVRASQFKLFSLLILVLQMACARKQDANEPVRAPLTQLSCGRSSKIQGESSSLALSEISAKILVDEKPSQVGVGCKKIPAEIEGFLKIYSNFANHTTYLLTDVSGKKFKLLPPANHFSVWHTGDWIQVQGERFECPAKSTFDVLESDTEGFAFADPVRVHESGGVFVNSAQTLAEPKLGAQSTAVLLLNFTDLPNSESVEDAQNVVFDSVNGFWRENSFNRAWITGQVLGPYNISMSQLTCDPDQLAALAQKAAKDAGIDLSKFSHWIYSFPENRCDWLGLGTVGGAPSEAWINGTLTLHTVAHELGHNLGLYHAKALDCGCETLASGCKELEYADPTDVMGNRLAGHYTAFQKEQLGWLGSAEGVPVSTLLEAVADGNYSIAPYEQMPTGKGGDFPRAIKVLQGVYKNGAGVETKNYFYVEYRQASGFDQVFATTRHANNLTQGVVIHLGNDSNVDSSLLLNMHPKSRTFYQAALEPGSDFIDPFSGLSVQLVAADSSRAQLKIAFKH